MQGVYCLAPERFIGLAAYVHTLFQILVGTNRKAISKKRRITDLFSPNPPLFVQAHLVGDHGDEFAVGGFAAHVVDGINAINSTVKRLYLLDYT